MSEFPKAPRPYWYQLADRVCRFQTYGDAWVNAQQNGSPQIWFTDTKGEHRVEHIHGQEAFIIGAPSERKYKPRKKVG